MDYDVRKRLLTEGSPNVGNSTLDPMVRAQIRRDLLNAGQSIVQSTKSKHNPSVFSPTASRGSAILNTLNSQNGEAVDPVDGQIVDARNMVGKPRLKTFGKRSVSLAQSRSSRAAAADPLQFTKDVGLNDYVHETLKSYNDTYNNLATPGNRVAEQYLQTAESQVIKQYLNDMEAYQKLK